MVEEVLDLDIRAPDTLGPSWSLRLISTFSCDIAYSSSPTALRGFGPRGILVDLDDPANHHLPDMGLGHLDLPAASLDVPANRLTEAAVVAPRRPQS